MLPEVNWLIMNTELQVQQKLLGAKLHELPYGLIGSKLGFGSSDKTPSPPSGSGGLLNTYA